MCLHTLAIGQLDDDPAVVLRQRRDLLSAIDRHFQLVDPTGQYAFNVVLTQPEQAVVPRWKVADVQPDHVEAHDLKALSLRQKPVGDPTLIQNFDRACMQAARTQANKLLVGTPFDNGNVDTHQREFSCQHQPCRATSGNHHRMIGHYSHYRTLRSVPLG